MKSKLSLTLAGILLGLTFITLLPGLGLACVWVNGSPLSYDEIRYAESLQGGQIACGSYIFDSNTGAWWDIGRQRGGYLGSGYRQQPQDSYNRGGSEGYSVDSYAGGYVGGNGDCTTIVVPGTDYTYLGDGC